MSTSVTPFRTALEAIDGVAGSLHRCEGDHLVLVTSIGLPEAVIDIVRHVPRGKGMAGHAWATGEPVSTCHLGSDPNPVIQPGARAVDAQSAIAIPVFDSKDRVIGVVGFAFKTDRNLDPTTVGHLQTHAAALATDYLNTD